MRSIVVFGDALAGAIAIVLDRIAGISGKYGVVHLGAENVAASTRALAECALFLHQEPYEAGQLLTAIPAGCERIAFPSLELRYLWPFTCVNPFNRPEPPRYPNGRFPYGDSFIISCLQQHVNPDKIVEYYLSVEWDVSWPDLQSLHQTELERLDWLEARTDVKMVPYIQEYASQRRLFWGAAGPTNALLCELIIRLLDRMFASKVLITRRVLTELLYSFGDRDLFGQIAVPIHPRVAEYFSLQWYNPTAGHQHFDEILGYREYFERMIEASLAATRL
ncbi:MAG TPA: WcbI family polysaccharide biosynthesis putative acetyltransferase [Candidatus Dormibacteraeota bacterium]|nr:WcbI family polysaccharide biosynthesis putative acetyltransferase [Candidatus Dormibacteraeota bacterium]